MDRRFAGVLKCLVLMRISFNSRLDTCLDTVVVSVSLAVSPRTGLDTTRQGRTCPDRTAKKQTQKNTTRFGMTEQATTGRDRIGRDWAKPENEDMRNMSSETNDDIKRTNSVPSGGWKGRRQPRQTEGYPKADHSTTRDTPMCKAGYHSTAKTPTFAGRRPEAETLGGAPRQPATNPGRNIHWGGMTTTRRKQTDHGQQHPQSPTVGSVQQPHGGIHANNNSKPSSKEDVYMKQANETNIKKATQRMGNERIQRMGNVRALHVFRRYSKSPKLFLCAFCFFNFWVFNFGDRLIKGTKTFFLLFGGMFVKTSVIA